MVGFFTGSHSLGNRQNSSMNTATSPTGEGEEGGRERREKGRGGREEEEGGRERKEGGRGGREGEEGGRERREKGRKRVRQTNKNETLENMFT